MKRQALANEVQITFSPCKLEEKKKEKKKHKQYIFILGSRFEFEEPL